MSHLPSEACPVQLQTPVWHSSLLHLDMISSSCFPINWLMLLPESSCSPLSSVSCSIQLPGVSCVLELSRVSLNIGSLGQILCVLARVHRWEAAAPKLKAWGIYPRPRVASQMHLSPSGLGNGLVGCKVRLLGTEIRTELAKLH